MTKISKKIKIGDIVEVIAGDDAGQSGAVLALFPAKGLVRVEGVNKHTRHRKAQGGQEGGTFTIFLPIHISNVKPKDAKKKKPVKATENKTTKKKTTK